MKKTFLFASILGAALTSCNEDDLGFTREQIRISAYERNFVKEFGKIDAGQDWDFYRQMREPDNTTRAISLDGFEVGELRNQTTNDPGTTLLNRVTSRFANKANNSNDGELAGAMSNTSEEPMTFDVYTVQYGGDFEKHESFVVGIEIEGQQEILFTHNTKSTTVINPGWIRTVTIPGNTTFRFFIRYDHWENTQRCPDCYNTGKAPGKEGCTDCGGTGFVPCTADRSRYRNHSVAECTTCHRTGMIPCKKCLGGYTISSNRIATCPTCNGTHNNKSGENRQYVISKPAAYYTHTIYSDGMNCVVAYDATNGTEAIIGLGFEDTEESIVNENVPDWDYNDCMILIRGTLPEVQATKRFFCEDLSGSNDAKAWDFNDLVFDVQSTRSQGTNVFVQAVGGTLPLKLYIDGKLVGDGDGELHKWMGVDDYTHPINVAAARNSETVPAKKFNIPDLNITDMPGFKKISIVVTDPDGSTRTVSFQEPGNAARIFAVPANVRWMKEDQHIRSGYNGFWTTDSWFNMVSDESKVY